MNHLTLASLPVVVLVGSLLSPTSILAVQDRDQAISRIDPDGIQGALVIVGGGRIPPEVTEAFRELAGDAPRLVVIPTASASADDSSEEALINLWTDRGFDHVTVLHTSDRDRANDSEFSGALREASAVWFGGGNQSRIASVYLGTAVESEIVKVLQREGVVGGTSAGAAIMSRLMITGGNPVASVGEGFDLLPDAVVDQHFLARNRQPRLQGVLNDHPEKFGVGIDEATALIVRGRALSVVGRSTVTIMLSASGSRSERTVELASGDSADLTALRRSARDRSGDQFPPEIMKSPRVKRGSLVIVGGGRLPDEVVDRFVQLAGGEDARIVVVPTATEGRISRLPQLVPGVAMFQDRGVRSVRVLYGRQPEEIETPEQLAMLREATGLWFGGGRQWRFVDAYEGTVIVELFHDVLRRGGVIGGSSAGATIQGEYLVRGNPLGNTDMMADGYERGFGFLPGVAIDQHFAERNRFRDLKSVVDRFPQLLGIGVDEQTALVVTGSVGEVLGQGSVHVFHRSMSVSEHGNGFGTLAPKTQYDLVQRTIIEASVAEACECR